MATATSRPRPRRRSLTAKSDQPARDAALRLLARREHAVEELRDKLARRQLDREAVDLAVVQLEAEGLVSDSRFAEEFVRERVSKGDGPVKIHAALLERGVDATDAELALAPYADEWLDRAWAVYRHRYGDGLPSGWHERARRVRYLQQRGFPADIVQRVTSFSDRGDCD